MKKKAIIFGWVMSFLVLLVACNASAASVTMSAATGIEGIEWMLVEVSGASVSPLADEKQPHILFDPAQNKVTGFAGCNRFFSGYAIDEAALKFGPIGSTRMSCPDLQLRLETAFLKALDKTNGWKNMDGMLLLLNDSEVLARFTKKINQGGITGTVWQWVQTLYNDDKKVVPADPGSYTVQFRENGTLEVKADCNRKRGAYSSAEKHLSLEITHSTMAACPEGSLEDAFVRALSAAAIYFIRDGNLYIDLQYDTGTMKFSKQKEE